MYDLARQMEGNIEPAKSCEFSNRLSVITNPNFRDK
jgi:hypothetical protein